METKTDYSSTENDIPDGRSPFDIDLEIAGANTMVAMRQLDESHPFDEEEEDVCVICLTNPATNQLEKCKHKVVCSDEECLKMVLEHNKCPICRRESNRRIVDALTGDTVGKFVKTQTSSLNLMETGCLLMCIITCQLGFFLIAALIAGSISASFLNDQTLIPLDETYLGRLVLVSFVRHSFVMISILFGVLTKSKLIHYLLSDQGTVPYLNTLRRYPGLTTISCTILFVSWLPPVATVAWTKIDFSNLVLSEVVLLVLDTNRKVIMRKRALRIEREHQQREEPLTLEEDTGEKCNELLLNMLTSVAFGLIIYGIQVALFIRVQDIPNFAGVVVAVLFSLFNNEGSIPYLPYIFPQFFVSLP